MTKTKNICIKKFTDMFSWRFYVECNILLFYINLFMWNLFGVSPEKS